MRSRLESIRDEIRAKEQELDGERAASRKPRLTSTAVNKDLAKLRDQLENEQQLRAVDHAQHTERAAVLEAAVAQMRRAQEKLAEQEQVNTQRAEELHKCATVLVEKEGTSRRCSVN